MAEFTPTDKVIETVGLHKRFGDNPVLCGINMSVSLGERVSIIGASGSGKSTFLRCINFRKLQVQVGQLHGRT